jgi:hypothetical protein
LRYFYLILNIGRCNSGKGVFSKEKIPRNTYLGDYIGKKYGKETNIFSNYSIETYYGGIIDAQSYPRSIFAMINDSRFSEYKNNCEFIIKKELVQIWTTKFIDKNHELFIDYGDDYWINR